MTIFNYCSGKNNKENKDLKRGKSRPKPIDTKVFKDINLIKYDR